MFLNRNAEESSKWQENGRKMRKMKNKAAIRPDGKHDKIQRGSRRTTT